jgi:hypothetical protein
MLKYQFRRRRRRRRSCFMKPLQINQFYNTDKKKIRVNTEECLLKARIVKPAETAVAREWLYKQAHC